MSIQLSEWISIHTKLPDGEVKNGTMVLVMLAPKKEGSPRVYGDVQLGVYYKGKFHWNFNKGSIQDVTHWMPLPAPKHRVACESIVKESWE